MKARLMLSLVLLGSAGMAPAIEDQEAGFGPPKPGKFHEYLKQFVGTWEVESEFFLSDNPKATPVRGKGTQTDRLTCNGLFLMMEFRGRMMGAECQGHGIIGYDTLKKRYTGSWIDSMSTSIWTSEGVVDEAGRVFTATMEGPDFSGKMIKMKFVAEITGKDTRTFTFSLPGEDGKEFTCGKTSYKRILER